mmetsp:Transcript_19519/g.26785  ORF Transcript_19519/g.26785 Transcript_19519/m.26785 type:complete len:122 (-) Transcript_19519:218-583(-)|eukprot:CAMPEP_0185738596 /NCGR_PEP_ID=MMETSP1171-20130828/33390_1 /TAXON_ID=374046 /ORGANISM="Helicotheca tamensis, Strain CCMP826" /LENGTH=121 /DNA_ID=CAMNT_0028409897 /DNA_START=37 /DNA_END=402 /DNA_ORIENTATION=-
MADVKPSVVVKEELKPGQKFPTPTPGFGDRVFYETLLRQRPDSAMAQEWCVNYGVLPSEEAAKLFKVVTKRKKNQKSGVPVSPSPTKKPKKSSKKKKILREDGFEAGMQVGGSEGMGNAAI